MKRQIKHWVYGKYEDYTLDKMIGELEKSSKELRRNTILLSKEYNSFHLGGSLSSIEILNTLYSCFLKPNDRFVLSKGHACIPYYLLLREQKYNPKISDHPDIDAANGICCSTGSLGHGLPIGVGMSLAKKIKNEPGKVYVLIGDGECQEGTVWESLMIAAHHKLNNLTVIIDNNQLQGSGRIEDILSLGDIKNKIESFGCYAIKVDGHSYRELIAAFEKKNKKPKVIIAETIKGKGISLMENNPVWHSRWPTLEQINMALQELT